MNQKHWQSIYVNVNIDLMEETVIQINGRVRIMMNIDVSVKNVSEKD